MILPHRLLLLMTAVLLALAGCGDPDPQGPAAAGPVDPDTVHAERDTVQTPVGTPDPGAAALREASATLEPVGDSGVMGLVRFQEVEDGTIVSAEIGGLEEGAHDLRILATRSCDRLQETAPFDPAGVRAGDPQARPAGSLDQVDVLYDGTGRYESLHPNLRLAGERSVMGRAVVAIEGGHHHAQHPDDQIVACGIIRADGGR